MKAARTPKHAAQESLLDEAFLRRVDHAMLRSKQRDPHRLNQVRRAVDEEVRLAHLTGEYDFDFDPKADR
ncbi:hypothetical protein J2W25_005679 [Variovorax boronicumulans]|uniref:Uncharacterized protein n=1 Tax=Variovorax boronicumulans TaxID=436515 RepID=A0AAW8E4Y9_9BURK|nr:hypothetical protein [Variovorax boronicumulans]MDP9881343.1 hypothetical protein [Variovorax boronicumulans]MDP9926630.1 hypothetical protein [Variovorax boronicumulans]